MRESVRSFVRSSIAASALALTLGSLPSEPHSPPTVLSDVSFSAATGAAPDCLRCESTAIIDNANLSHFRRSLAVPLPWEGTGSTTLTEGGPAQGSATLEYL
jgi:hypothetical protein